MPGQMVPKKEWHEWCILFRTGHATLGPPLGPPQPPPSPQDLITASNFHEFLTATGEWDGSCPVGTAAQQPDDSDLPLPVVHNEILGEALGELMTEAREVKPKLTRVAPVEHVRELPLCMAVVGPPASGKSSVCFALAADMSLKVGAEAIGGKGNGRTG